MNNNVSAFNVHKRVKSNKVRNNSKDTFMVNNRKVNFNNMTKSLSQVSTLDDDNFSNRLAIKILDNNMTKPLCHVSIY